MNSQLGKRYKYTAGRVVDGNTSLRMRAACAALLLCFSLFLVPGCARDDLTGPPELRLGRDTCGECGMLISEDRCSSALLVESRKGRVQRDYIIFDDISCMVDFTTKGHEFTIIETFVRDYSAREWTTAGAAYFIHAENDRLRTPMGSGMVAFAARAAAEKKQRQVDGKLMNYDELTAVRRSRTAGR